MKNLKNTAVVLFTSAMLLITPSCKKDIQNFLDQAPEVAVNENTIFSSRAQLETFLATIYKFSLPSLYGGNEDITLSPTYSFQNLNSSPGQPSGSISDEGDASQQTYIQTNAWNLGQITPGNIIDNEDRRYFQRWVALRQIAIMISRVDEVPDPGNYSGTIGWAAYKTQIKGEVKALRAFIYLEMVKRYGGVPIVDKAFNPGDNINTLVPRANIEDVFKFIVKDCDEAVQALPSIYDATQTGRVTKTAALAIKARALLYAASPLFNTATPYLNMTGGGDNKLLCYGNYDINRWKLAADAAYAVLTEAPNAGVKLVDVPTAASRDPLPVTPANQPVKGNYSNSWEVMGNSEVILTFQGYAAATPTNPPLRQINPNFSGSSRSGVTVTFNHTSKYENKLTGLPQVWGTSGTDLLTKYRELDPRYAQSVCYTGSYWNPGWPSANIYVGGPDGSYSGCLGGAWMHKLIQRAGVVKSGFASIRVDVVDFVLRLNEFYLDYAEAINEFSGPGKATEIATPYITATLPDITVPLSAYDAVNKIRLRSGMPPFPANANLSKEQFRARVRNERAVELAFDDQRFWDIKRWMIAEQDGVMQGGMYGITNIVPNGATYSWQIGPQPFETRVWFRKEYLHPFPDTEVLKGGLIQNPGW